MTRTPSKHQEATTLTHGAATQKMNCLNMKTSLQEIKSSSTEELQWVVWHQFSHTKYVEHQFFTYLTCCTSRDVWLSYCSIT